MTRFRPVVPLAAALLMGGCAPEPEVRDRPIVSAGLHRFDLSRFAIVGGFLDGDAILVFEELDGDVRSMNVRVEGGTVGLVMDMAWDPDGAHSVPLDLSRVDGQPMLHDLFAVYRGTGAGAGVMIEGGARRVKNKHGVSFREDHLGLGIGLHAGFEWIGLKEGGRERDNPLFDTGIEPIIPRGESGGGCSGKVEDETEPTPTTSPSTGAPSTGTPSTGTPAGEPSDGEDLPPLEQSSGCGGGGGGCSGPDDDPDPTPTTDPTGTGTATGSTGTATSGTGTTGTGTSGTGTGTTGTDSSGSGCDCEGEGESSSSACDCDSSSCAHGGHGRLPPLSLLLLGIAARRRKLS